MHWRNYLALILIGLTACLLFACSSTEEKRDSFMAKGQDLADKKDYMRARLEFKNAVKVDPQCVDCFAGLAKTELALKNLRGAYAAYSRAVELAPDRLDIQTELTRLLLLGRSHDKAEEKARLILSKEPDNLEAQILLAFSLSRMKDKNEEALSILKDVRNAEPSRPEGYILAANILYSQGNPAKAEALIKNGMEKADRPHAFLQSLLSLYFKEKNWDKALETAKKLEAIVPDNAASYQAFAQIYEKIGKLDQAKKSWQTALEKDPDNTRIILAFADFWIRQRKFSEAEKVLRDVLSKEQASLEIRLALARLLAVTGRSPAAIELLEHVHQKDLTTPQRIALLNERAGLLFSLGKLDKCQDLVSEVLEENPKDTSALLTQARLQLVRRESASAVTTLRTLLNDAPENTGYMLLLAEAHMLNKEVKLAEDQLRNVIQKTPKDPKPRQALAKLYMLGKDIDLALKTIDNALKSIPESAVLYEFQGRIRWLKGNPVDAERSFRKAMELAPEWLVPYRSLAGVLARSGKLDKAEKELKEAISKHPQAGNLKILLATFYEQTGKSRSAISVYEELLIRAPGHPLVCNNLAYLYAETSNDTESFARAMELIDLAETKLPGKATILDTKAWVTFKSGDTEKALEIISQALALAEEHAREQPIFLYHQGVILSELGRTEEARAALQKVMDDQRPFREREAAQKLLADL